MKICSVFDVLALSELMKVRKGKKRGEETRRERTEQKNTEKAIQESHFLRSSQNGNSLVTAPRPPICYIHIGLVAIVAPHMVTCSQNPERAEVRLRR